MPKPHMIILVGMTLVFLGVVGATAAFVGLSKWTWEKNLWFTLIIGAYTVYLLNHRESAGAAVTAGLLLTAVLTITTLILGAVAWVDYLEGPKQRNPLAVTPMGPNKWEIMYNPRWGPFPTGLTLDRPGDKLELTSIYPFFGVCRHWNNRTESRFEPQPWGRNWAVIIPFEQCKPGTSVGVSLSRIQYRGPATGFGGPGTESRIYARYVR